MYSQECNPARSFTGLKSLFFATFLALLARFEQKNQILELRKRNTFCKASVCPNYSLQFAKKDFSKADPNIKGY